MSNQMHSQNPDAALIARMHQMRLEADGSGSGGAGAGGGKMIGSLSRANLPGSGGGQDSNSDSSAYGMVTSTASTMGAAPGSNGATVAVSMATMVNMNDYRKHRLRLAKNNHGRCKSK